MSGNPGVFFLEPHYPDESRRPLVVLKQQKLLNARHLLL